MPNESEKKHKGTHKAAFPIGLLVTLLAFIGLATVVTLCVTAIRNAAEKSKDYSEFNKLLTPIVLIDPSNFDDITKADMSELIEMSIWSILKSDISPDTYQIGEGGLIIPEADVTAQFQKLFGTEVKPVHATVEGYEYEFTYDADAKTYTIPITGVVPIYTPKVIDKKETADQIILTVALLSGEAWQQGADGAMVEPGPDKYIKVTLRVKDGAQFISAIQATTTPETATTLTPASETTTENADLLDKADVVAKESEASETQAEKSTAEEQSSAAQ